MSAPRMFPGAEHIDAARKALTALEMELMDGEPDATVANAHLDRVARANHELRMLVPFPVADLRTALEAE